jgi:tripartite-type tricarboxylate transporter receptor subunit TctC
MPHLKSGKAKPIAVTTEKRSPAFPDLPTMTSLYPGFVSDNWYAMFFPKNTPRAVVDRMNAAVKKALDSPEVKTFMTREALEAIASSPEELTAKFKSDQARYAKVIKAANIKAE